MLPHAFRRSRLVSNFIDFKSINQFINQFADATQQRERGELGQHGHRRLAKELRVEQVVEKGKAGTEEETDGLFFS